MFSKIAIFGAALFASADAQSADALKAKCVIKDEAEKFIGKVSLYQEPGQPVIVSSFLKNVGKGKPVAIQLFENLDDEEEFACFGQWIGNRGGKVRFSGWRRDEFSLAPVADGEEPIDISNAHIGLIDLSIDGDDDTFETALMGSCSIEML